MPKYLWKALDGASAAGPGSTLMFQHPVSFNDVYAQTSVVGSPTYQVGLELTLNGVDFETVPGSDTFSGLDGSYIHLGSVPLIMGFRLNITSFSGSGSPSVTALLAIDEKD